MKIQIDANNTDFKCVKRKTSHTKPRVTPLVFPCNVSDAKLGVCTWNLRIKHGDQAICWNILVFCLKYDMTPGLNGDYVEGCRK